MKSIKIHQFPGDFLRGAKPLPPSGDFEKHVAESIDYSGGTLLHEVYDITVKVDADDCSPADITDMYAIVWREADLPDDRTGVFEVDLDRSTHAWLVYSDYNVRHAMELAAKQTHKGNRKKWAHEYLEKWAKQDEDNLQNGNCVVTVIASLKGVELGRASIGGTDWTSEGVRHCVLDYGLMEEAVADADKKREEICAATCTH